MPPELDTTAEASALRGAAAAAANAARVAPSGNGFRPLAATSTGAAGSYLTGDGGVVLLDAELTYRVADPETYFLSEPHVVPALDRAFRAAAVRVAAMAPLDDFLVVDQSRASGRAAANAALRAALLTAINERVRDMGALGVEVTRLDLTASLPPAAKTAFDSVLTATQMADQALANARTDATRRAQEANRAKDQRLNTARASAAERVSNAQAHGSTVEALAKQMTPETEATCSINYTATGSAAS